MIQRLRQMRNEEGFTLIELLIVIIVLGILAAIVVFAVGNTRDDAVESACNTQLRSVELSAEAINTNEGSYPLGNFNINSANNPILAGTLDNGALLKSWPSDADFVMQYVGIDSDALSAGAEDYEVRVYPDTFTAGIAATNGAVYATVVGAADGAGGDVLAAADGSQAVTCGEL
jgi:general secretion pathway protein G